MTINKRDASIHANDHMLREERLPLPDDTRGQLPSLSATMSVLSMPARSAYRTLWRASSATFAGDAPVLTGA
jgi:hypothetical protein